jgi:cbb3-type cytochrome oxidase subunit 3
MIQEFVRDVGNHWLSTITLVAMTLLFIALVIQVYRGGRHRYDHESRLPLDETAPSALNSDLQGAHHE